MSKDNEFDCIEFLKLPKSESERLREMGWIAPDGEVDQHFMMSALRIHALSLTSLEPDLKALAPFYERLGTSSTAIRDLLEEVTRIFTRLQAADPWIADLLLDMVERMLEQVQEPAAVAAFKELRKRFIREPSPGPKGRWVH